MSAAVARFPFGFIGDSHHHNRTDSRAWPLIPVEKNLRRRE
jgi:hypothetical protein